jgi:hypothetical protein
MFKHDSEGGEAFSAFVSSEGGKQQYATSAIKATSRGKSEPRIRVALLAQWRCCWCEAQASSPPSGHGSSAP